MKYERLRSNFEKAMTSFMGDGVAEHSFSRPEHTALPYDDPSTQDCFVGYQAALASMPNKQLYEANAALVKALNRLHDVVTGDEFMDNPDIEVHELINTAIKLHEQTKKQD